MTERVLTWQSPLLLLPAVKTAALRPLTTLLTRLSQPRGSFGHGSVNVAPRSTPQSILRGNRRLSAGLLSRLLARNHPFAQTLAVSVGRSFSSASGDAVFATKRLLMMSNPSIDGRFHRYQPHR